MADLTVRDIAAFIQRPGESLTTAIDRLRNWTDMGIIKPEGPKRPGTGRKRHYSVYALLDAVLLQALVDALGDRAASLFPFPGGLGQLSQIAAIGKGIDAHFKGPLGPKLVVLSRSDDDEPLKVGMVERGKLESYLSKSKNEIHVVLDLERLSKKMPMVLFQKGVGAVLADERVTGLLTARKTKL